MRWAALRDTLYRTKWNTYAKRPFGGPKQVLRYLGSYTHRVAISDHRLIAMKDGKVSFRYKDSMIRTRCSRPDRPDWFEVPSSRRGGASTQRQTLLENTMCGLDWILCGHAAGPGRPEPPGRLPRQAPLGGQSAPLRALLSP